MFMTPPDSTVPSIVAHRGNAAEFPENTLPAIQSALELGVTFVEFDIQLTADAKPVLFHDEKLKRTTGRGGTITDLPWRAVREIPAHEPKRFGDRFGNVTIPSLEQAVSLLQDWPQAYAFVEIKKESVRGFGIQRVMGVVLPLIAGIHERCAIISFEREAIEATPKDLPRGWALRGFDDQWLEAARTLAPDFLFVNYKRLPKRGELWPGPWRWCVYDIPDPDRGLKLCRRGAQLIETVAVRNYADDPRFAEQLR